MTSTVHYADMRTGVQENLFDKLSRLLITAGLEQTVAAGDLTAIKLHFGERGGHAYIRPPFIGRIVEQIKGCGGQPFLTDSSTLYPGERKNAVMALNCAVANGFAYAVVGAPLIMCDGLRGQAAQRVAIDGEILKEVDIGQEILEADSLIVVSHFKGHELTGFGGALKNLGMGCASRAGKLQQHGNLAPQVDAQECIGCATCLRACSHQAIALHRGRAYIDPQRCVGCARCISLCPVRAIQVQWTRQSALVMRKMAEYAKGALHNKAGKALFVNFVTQVSPRCDCYGHSDAAIVADQGLLVSSDPVAIDQASVDLVNRAPGLAGTALQQGLAAGDDKFRALHPAIDWTVSLEHATRLGLGQRTYELRELQPRDKGC